MKAGRSHLSELLDSHTDYRKFIIEALEHLGRNRREFAKHLGLSFAMLSSVLSAKRRMRASLVPSVVEFFELDEDAAQILAAMIDLDNDSARARRTAWAAIQARQTYLLGNQPSAAALTMMSSWHLLAIHELATCDEFRADPRWIAATLNPPITVSEAEEAIQTLKNLGLLVEADGVLTASEPSGWTEHQVPPGFQSEAVAHLQYAMMDHAKRALRAFRWNERHSSTTTFGITEDQYERIEARLRQVEREIMHICMEAAPVGRNRVYHLGIQLFPVTDFSDTEYDPLLLDEEEE